MKASSIMGLFWCSVPGPESLHPTAGNSPTPNLNIATMKNVMNLLMVRIK